MCKGLIYNKKTKSLKGHMDFKFSSSLFIQIRLTDKYKKSFAEFFNNFLEKNNLIISRDESSFRSNYSKNPQNSDFFETYLKISKNKHFVKKFKKIENKKKYRNKK